jgi:5-methylcytosine-specific restriction endonuclease McrA
MRLLAALLAGAVALSPVVSTAHPGGVDSSGCHTNRKTGGYHCHGGGSSSSYATTTSYSSGTKGKRSSSARSAFRRNHPCPATGKTSGACPGYHVDHVVPLACGGADDPSNMQWLTATENLRKGDMGCAR